MNVMPICWTWFCVINITETLILRRPSCRPRCIEVCSYGTKWLYIICMSTTWLKCALWGTRFPPTLCQWCGRGRSLYYWINDLTVIQSCSLLPPSWMSATYVWIIEMHQKSIDTRYDGNATRTNRNSCMVHYMACKCVVLWEHPKRLFSWHSIVCSKFLLLLILPLRICHIHWEISHDDEATKLFSRKWGKHILGQHIHNWAMVGNGPGHPKLHVHSLCLISVGTNPWMPSTITCAAAGTSHSALRHEFDSG